MSLQLLLKCSVSLLIIIFLLYPKGIQSLASIGKQQDYYHAIRKPGREDFSQRRADFNVLKMINLGDEINGQEELRGFDLTEDEMKTFKMWPDGIVPYFIDPVSLGDKYLRDQIRSLLTWISTSARTSISFQELPVPPKDESTRWVFFSNRRGQLGCSDHSILNFTTSGIQLVNMGYDCLRGDIGEALLLLLGIPAQHNAPNRDDYIEVIEENIIPEKRYLYKKLNDSEWIFHDLNYDFESVTHYGAHRNTVNGHATIVPKNRKYDNIIGQARGYSQIDLIKIRLLYNYIVNTPKQIPNCNKLFKKSPNYYKQLDGVDELRPKKKPNKYLGIDEPDKSESFFEDSASKEENNEGDDNNDDPENEISDADSSPKNDKYKMRGKNNKKSKGINLQFLSDYISS